MKRVIYKGLSVFFILLKRVIYKGLSVFFILFISLLLLEFCYRFYIIDFYGPIFKAINKESDLKKTNVDFLVFGDSFSVSYHNYVKLLNERHKDKIFINSSVLGFGIKQVNIMAASRIKKYKPKAIIYQVYVGNDLIDIDHLSNWKELSFIRNIYWTLSDKLISLSYINYRLGVFKQKTNIEAQNVNLKESSFKDYNSRTKLYFKTDSEYLYKSVVVNHDFENRYNKWKSEIKGFLKKVPDDTKVYVLFIPHCAQVNNFYFENMKKIGADINNASLFNMESYGFFEKASIDFRPNKNMIFLNPLKHLRDIDSLGNRLYYINDPHMNANGNIVLANYIDGYIFDNKY